ncbi:hypothetical protein U0C82_18310 [Fulvimarina sp. 2208YS6-2-32]|uniref:Uncharacterized protein n=1 Tax=Fulvimarina uroteuthidis TaxID=3098149 RepID=A0ABU5I6R9_9HYPH|nr:hypothetical protein [Fulvimarina sp. 2208YS6-2-32]MDY8111080.1 hypothetical protein [Fulvimarina sp. 2208YS6-2-32]
MTSKTASEWAERFRADLEVSGERVPFDRVLKTHRAAIASLRERGLTWASIARLLAHAGVNRGEGKLYSADHLRVAFRRTKQSDHDRSPQDREPNAVERVAPNAPTERSKNPRPGPFQSSDPLPGSHQSTRSRKPRTRDFKDVSGEELETALSRLERIKPKEYSE